MCEHVSTQLRAYACMHICKKKTKTLHGSSPIGLGRGKAIEQSKGRLLWDQITGCTFCWMLMEIATILQVSARTATRLNT